MTDVGFSSMLAKRSRIEEATGRRVNVMMNPNKAGGVPRLAADINRANQVLDFRPRVDLTEGLRQTLERDPRFRNL